MTRVFQTVLTMSTSATWVVLAVIAARLLLRKAPKWANCALWALVALRLVCPVSIESPWSLVPSQVAVVEEFAAHEPRGEGSPATDRPMTALQAVPDNFPFVPKESRLLPEPEHSIRISSEEASVPGWLTIGTYVWLAGALFLSGYALISYRRIQAKVGACIDLGNGVYLCDYIDTPFILGVAHPHIYLPSAIDPADAAHVLAHERAHLVRRDHWWKPLGFGLLVLHWFNPLLWLAYVLLCRDIELACDERVIQELAGPEKKSYSEALLKCSVPRSAIVACPLAFGEVGVKQRIRTILHYKKPGFWMLLASILAITMVALCFLTDPQKNTLANILEIREDVVCIDLRGRKGAIRYEGEELADILALMESLEYDPAPASEEIIPGDYDENFWLYWLCRIFYEGEEENIFSNYDHTLVWTRDADGNTSLPYRLKDPELLNQFLSDHVTPVINRYVEQERQGTADEPAAWLGHVKPEHISTARAYIIYEDQTMDTGYLSNSQLSQAIEILNSLPASALGDPVEAPHFTYSDMRYFLNSSPGYSDYSGITLALQDDAWNLSALVRSYEEGLELVLLRDYDWTGDVHETQPGSGWLWKIESPELADYLLGLRQDPPDLLTFAGSRYEFLQETLTLTDGQFTLQTPLIQSWDYEITFPEEGEDSFGFRCRPRGETEGWVYFAWCGENFTPPKEGEYLVSNHVQANHLQDSSEYLKLYLAPQPNTWNRERYLEGEYMPWIYQRYACEHGDFLIVNENADSWAKKYADDLGYIKMFITQTFAGPSEG